MKILFELPAEVWNQAARALWRARALPGPGVWLAWREDGTLVSAHPVTRWQHPWFTTPLWNPSSKRWEVTIRPGFVNGDDPLAQGVPSIDADGVEREDTPLLDRPRIPVNAWRAIGNDEGDAPVPGFFQALGVRKNTVGLTGDIETGITIEVPLEDETPIRHLRAVDFVLFVARETLVGQVEIVDPSGTSGLVADYAVALDTSRLEQLGRRARIRQEIGYEPAREPSLLDRLFGRFDEPSEDTVLISTLFMLSPPGAQPGDPDETWTPYVAHNLFWNLAHAPRNERIAGGTTRIRLFTGLLGGLGDAIGNQFLAQGNEWTDRINNAINNVSRAGRFWTA